MGVLAYFAWSLNAANPPVYEEVHPVPSELMGQITRINLAVYESLYREKVPATDVLFLSVEPRQEKGMAWEFTEILVKIPEAGRIGDLETVIVKDLSVIGEKILSRCTRDSGGDSLIDLFTLGFFTHRIRLENTEKQRTTKIENLPMIAIIIDDMGYDLGIARAFLEMEIPFTFSIISTAPHAVAIAREAKKRGCELILHLPMEPKNYPQVNPGPGAILADMNDEAIAGALELHLQRVPGIRGVNNHMGSRFTEIEEKMAAVFHELKRRNLFYIDSRTTHRSVAVTLGEKMGVAVATRGIFLDNHLSPAAMKFQTERLLGLARSTGSAIAIGHPHKQTLKSLKDSLERIRKESEIVPVSEILMRQQNASRVARDW